MCNFQIFFNCDSQSNLRLKQNKMNAEYYKHPGTTTFLKRKMQYFKFYFLYFGFFSPQCKVSHLEDIWLSHLVKRVIADCEMASVSLNVNFLFSIFSQCLYHLCLFLSFVYQYDLSASQFSPDGRVFQVEYAVKAVENSGQVEQCDILNFGMHFIYMSFCKPTCYFLQEPLFKYHYDEKKYFPCFLLILISFLPKVSMLINNYT